MLELLRAESVVFRYPARPGKDFLLDGVSFVVPQGMMVAVVGANGSGKSTLLKVLLGYARPTQGRVLVQRLDKSSDLVPLQGTLGRHFRLGYVAQTNSLDTKLTVAQNLDLAGMLFGIPSRERRERAERLTGVLGISDFRPAVVAELSGGQRRRADLARALMCDPQMLILDEGAAGLDGAALRDLASRLNNMLRDPSQGVSLRGVLLVSHLEAELEGADSFVALNCGRASRQIMRSELEGSARFDRLVLGLVEEGSEIRRAQVEAVLQRLGADQVLQDAPRSQGRVDCRVRDGQSFLPQLFASEVAAHIDNVELKPENLMDRVNRAAALPGPGVGI
jgi:ABC-type multidrug transport system ATPase subunit